MFFVNIAHHCWMGKPAGRFANDLIKPLKGITLSDGDDQTSGSIAGASVKSYTFCIIEFPQDIKILSIIKLISICRYKGILETNYETSTLCNREKE